MARLPRYIIPGQPQHIIQRGNNRQPIFAAAADYAFFRDVLVEAASKHQLAIHAYAWMTNHIHLLATPGVSDSISKVFQSTGRRYVQYFNHVYQRSGTLWEGRYRATVVDSEQYLLTLMRREMGSDTIFVSKISCLTPFHYFVRCFDHLRDVGKLRYNSLLRIACRWPFSACWTLIPERDNLDGNRMVSG